MATAQAELFLDRVDSDPELSARLTALADRPHLVFAIVTEQGFDTTPDEIRDAFFERSMRLLTEEQLSSIAAGLARRQYDDFGVAIRGLPDGTAGAAAAI